MLSYKSFWVITRRHSLAVNQSLGTNICPFFRVIHETNDIKNRGAWVYTGIRSKELMDSRTIQGGGCVIIGSREERRRKGQILVPKRWFPAKE